MRKLARGDSEATPARALLSVATVVGAVVVVVAAIVFVAYGLA
jgi:hypothetical protein